MNEEPAGATDPVVDAVVRASRALVGITVRALGSVSDEVMDKRRREIDAIVRHMSIEDRDRVVNALELFSRAADAPAAPDDDAPLVQAIAPPIPQTR